MVLKFVYRFLNFFLNWFEIEKWNFANAHMMKYISKTFFFFYCLML
jgi:hypothetical protein